MTNTFELHSAQFNINKLGFMTLSGIVLLLSLTDAFMLKSNFGFGTSIAAASSLCKLNTLYNNFGDSESYSNVANSGKMNVQDLTLLATNWRSAW